MKLASFGYRGEDFVGFEGVGGIVELTAAAHAAGLSCDYRNMSDLIQAGASARDTLQAVFRHVSDNPGAVEAIPLDEITWHPPVRRPYKIIGIALNNSASNARKISAPDHPLFFLKPASCLVGHQQPIVTRSEMGSVHPEPELAVVIGKDCKDVAAEDAMDCVFGYSIMNDMTGNAMRAEDMVHYYALYPKKDDPDIVEKREQHLSYTARYKGSDTFGPMGPWLVTKDELTDPHNLSVKCWHKDTQIAEDSTAFYTYSVEQVIAFVTRFHTLWAGDVISMGTAFRPQPGVKRSLHTADVTSLGGPVSVEISGIGRLENPVVNQ
ncbi:fumarylacetoacetate hydrolase family protein [Amorphus sp. 3PC139-8]|uniref:fumarylacetoacetate hydrolase family protein n=1 Tax=Amorphus sp. 3PC139-8 TaxID=2735676 RepID=UPI00345CA83D